MMAGSSNASEDQWDRALTGPRPVPLYAGLALLVALLFVASLCIGPVFISPIKLIGLLSGNHGDVLSLIAWEIRLPRALLGLAVGGSLGLAGAALQGFLRNPLSEPGIIGVSGCAALGTVLAFYLGAAGAAHWILPASGIAGALISVAAIYALAGRNASILTIILAGVAINSLAGALTTLVLSLSPNPFATYEIFFWLLGSLSNRSFEHVTLIAPFIVCGWLLLLTTGRALDALSLGEETATSLGIDLVRTRAQIIVGTALAVGSSVAVTGVVGFIGLVVPHLMRPLVGQRPGALLGASTLGGAALTLAADIGTRVPVVAGELRLGVVTALIGAPFFLHLVLRKRTVYQ